ncbi:MAG: hypothetical protein EP319_00420 [Deltaproteobacteria bacterium]|nr:MAG: hypothetical protein EP319_00420 [Deltaproteobacteria bacterium]
MDFIIEQILKLMGHQVGQQDSKKKKFFYILAWIIFFAIFLLALFVFYRIWGEQIDPKLDRAWKKFNYKQYLAKVIPQEYIEKTPPPVKIRPKTKDNLKEASREIKEGQFVKIRNQKFFEAEFENEKNRVYYSFKIDDYDDSIMKEIIFSHRNVIDSSEKDKTFKNGLPLSSLVPVKGMSIPFCLSGKLFSYKVVNFFDKEQSVDLVIETPQNKNYKCK